MKSAWFFPGALAFVFLTTGCVFLERRDTDEADAAQRYWTLDPNDPLLEKRTVLLFGRIDSASAEICIAKLLHLAARSTRPIDLYLLTPGGEMTAAIAIEQVMRGLRAPVNTIAIGECSSAGAFLLAAGTGKRTAVRGTTIVLHGMQFTGDPPPGAPENLQNYYTGFWLEEASLPEAWLPMAPGAVHALTAREALRFGVVDAVR